LHQQWTSAILISKLKLLFCGWVVGSAHFAR